MKKKAKVEAATTEPLPVISARIKEPLVARVDRIVEISKRTRTSVLEEALEHGLPKMERVYDTAA